MSTSREAELEFLKSWRPRSAFTHVDWFRRLIDGEFLDADKQQQRAGQAVQRILGLANAVVPYYRECFAQHGFLPHANTGIEQLLQLPVLKKEQLLENPTAFRARELPRGEKLAGETRSSGTTGQPVRIQHTANSLRLNGLLRVRQFRWYRFDPGKTFASIRLPEQLPRGQPDEVLASGETLRQERWPYLGEYFHTGPHVAYGVTNPVEDQLAWLEREQPDYLLSYAESLEHLALATAGESTLQLDGMLAISERLTAEMRQRIERAFGGRVFQNYGLNEAGVVAGKCREGDRYHVNTEHCLVEILDSENQPCAHGEQGRLVITVLSNPANPLIRYDTDDLAIQLTDACPCGRTLPSFGDIAGRYSRIAYLPQGSMARVACLRETLGAVDPALLTGLRRYQVAQLGEKNFELRLQSVSPITDALRQVFTHAWLEQGYGADELQVAQVDALESDPSGKFQDFRSVYFPQDADLIAK